LGYLCKKIILKNEQDRLMDKRLYISDEDFIKGIIKNEDMALSILYKLHFPMVLNFILRNNGNEDDAKDIYQEGIITLYNNIKNGIFKQESKIKTYLYSICRRIWLTELKRKSDFTGEIDDVNSFILIEKEKENQIKENDRKFIIMENSLKQLGEPCRTILKDFYIERLSMQDIADKMCYTNMENAKTQKYKCLQRLKKIYFSTYNLNNI